MNIDALSLITQFRTHMDIYFRAKCYCLLFRSFVVKCSSQKEGTIHKKDVQHMSCSLTMMEDILNKNRFVCANK